MHISGILAHKVNNDDVDLITTVDATPDRSRCHKKLLHPRTPSKSQSSAVAGAISSACSSTSSIQISYAAVMSTPPAKRFQRVRNPFEPVLAEALHLPLIGSPSLFQRPTTPQLSSTQFEWSIDEVSSLKPANVEPHETQFNDSPDPEYEAKAQSAISSYFKEYQIVPSPVDCPLRNQRIILAELNSYTPITKPGRRIRDYGTQTELSLPVVLPRALEEALLPYLQPHLTIAEGQTCEVESKLRFSSGSNASGGVDAKDISLRRKLFDMNNVVVLENDSSSPTREGKSQLSHSNSSPTSNYGSSRCGQFAIVGKLSDSLDKSSFGSLSPISASDGLSSLPHSAHKSASKLKSRLQAFLQDLTEAEQLSPIHPPARLPIKSRAEKHHLLSITSQTPSTEKYRCSALNYSEATTIGDVSLVCHDDATNNADKFTPDRSSSPLQMHNSSTDGEAAVRQHSIDSSFNIKVSRLAVNSSKCAKQQHMLSHDDILDIPEDDDLQMSQLSAHNFNCSSSSSTDTPRSKRRSASRKNLSQSFSLNWLEDEEQYGTKIEEIKLQHDNQILQNQPLEAPIIDITFVDEFLAKEHQQQQVQQQTTSSCNKCYDNVKHDDAKETPRANFYRTDSGFNDMLVSGSSSAYSMGASQQYDMFEGEQGASLSPTTELDVSMVCCSTPSKLVATDAIF